MNASQPAHSEGSAQTKAARPRPVLVNSIPKAGTHLVSKALSLVPGMDGEFVRLAPVAFQAVPGEATVDLGIGMPRAASVQRVHEALASLTPGQFALWHVPYSPGFHEVLVELNLAMIVLVRDPRDVVVSHARHIEHFTGHRLHARFLELTEAQRIDAVIDGVQDVNTGDTLLESLADRYAHLLAWRAHSPMLLVRFEDLVGERGGGSAEAQRTALRQVLAFLEVPAGAETIDRIAHQMFGATVTFRQGQIGAWHEHLSSSHVERIEATCSAVMKAFYPVPGVRPFLVNSFPKSGTKLLGKVCAMLPGVTPTPPDPRWRALSMIGEAWEAAPAVGTAGAKPEQPTTMEDAAQILDSVPTGRYIEYHIAHSRGLSHLLNERAQRMLMMVRDPRDAVVSLADYLGTAAHHPLHLHFKELSDAERLTSAIAGVRVAHAGGAELADVGTRYRRRLGWLHEPCAIVIRFEDLVGPAGGGDATRQRAALRAILIHLGIEPADALVTQLAEASFGGTRTFKHGRIGRWREVFTPAHEALFAQHADGILAALGYDAEPA